MEGLIQFGVVVLVALGIVVLVLLIPVLLRLQRTVSEAERTIISLREEAVPTMQNLRKTLEELLPTVGQLQQILESTDTILSESRVALMPAVKEVGVALKDDLVPSLREAHNTMSHLSKTARSLGDKMERIDRILSVVEALSHPQKVAKLVKTVASTPAVRPRVWLEALRKGFTVLKGEQIAETASAPEGSKNTEEHPGEKKGGEDYVGQ